MVFMISHDWRFFLRWPRAGAKLMVQVTISQPLSLAEDLYKRESVLHSNTVCHHCRWADIKAILLSRAIPKGHFKRQSLESEFGIVPCWLHSPASSGASFKSKAKSENCTVSLSFQAMRCKEKGKLSIFDSKIFQASESHEASPSPAFPHCSFVCFHSGTHLDLGWLIRWAWRGCLSKAQLACV